MAINIKEAGLALSVCLSLAGVFFRGFIFKLQFFADFLYLSLHITSFFRFVFTSSFYFFPCFSLFRFRITSVLLRISMFHLDAKQEKFRLRLASFRLKRNERHTLLHTRRPPQQVVRLLQTPLLLTVHYL